MAVKPYQEGDRWSFRLRTKGQDIYRTGFASCAEARREAERLTVAVATQGKPKNKGPWQTTLGEALQQYGLERLPAMKGARQDANRINTYLRTVGLDTLALETIPFNREAPSNQHFVVSLEKYTPVRKIPRGVKSHRAQQVQKTAKSNAVRKRLANMRFADICAYHVQELINAMVADGYKAASIGLERALLRCVFNYARKNWFWPEPLRNPSASDLTLPKVDNARSRVLTNKEWQNVSKHLAKEACKFVVPAIALLLETAMRASEPLLNATWGDLDWEKCTLHLVVSKTGARDVPLSPGAIEILKTLRALGDPAEKRIVPITYDTIKAAWNRARSAADIEDVNIHDLRHTAATRFTLELNGNMPVLKVITGHKTYSQLNRYINMKPEDVSRLLHGRPLTEDAAPAGLHFKRAALLPPPTKPTWSADDLPENVVPLRRTKEGLRAG